jgi:hypothetical protein
MKKIEVKRLHFDGDGNTVTDGMNKTEVKRLHDDSDSETETDNQIITDPELEEKYLKELDVDSSGFLIYPGTAPVQSRTGSQALDLIRWHLYKNSDIKPIDYNLFKELVFKMKLDDLQK